MTITTAARPGSMRSAALAASIAPMKPSGFERGDRSDIFLGLGYNDAYYSADGVFYHISNQLSIALANALEGNATTVKNALESFIKANGGTALTETDEYGHSAAGGLELGLYTVVETRVPESVTSTCNPFFVSLPMTTIDGDNWNYDVTVYPKNQTGLPTLEKFVREAKGDTGKNSGGSATLTVVNVKGFELPKTGSYGTWMFTAGGILAMGIAVLVMVKLVRKKKSM